MDAFLELFSFRGRVSRARYIWHLLLDGVVLASATAALVVVGLATSTLLVALPLAGLELAAAWVAIAVTVKRLHDLDRPGWHWFLFMIPIYSILLFIVTLVVKGTDGDNPYGPDPLGDPGELGRVR